MTCKALFAILISMILAPGPAAWAQQQPATSTAKPAAPVKYLKMGADPAAPLRMPTPNEDLVVSSKDACSAWATGSGKDSLGCYPPGTLFFVDRTTTRATGGLCGNVDKANPPIKIEGKLIPRESTDYSALIRRVAEAVAEQVLAKVKPSVTNNNISTGIQRVEVQAPEGTVLERVETNQQADRPATEVVVKLKNAIPPPPPPAAPAMPPAVKEKKASRCGKGCVIGIIAAGAAAAGAAAFFGGRSGAKSGPACCTATPPLVRP